jgi:hypothetical protein
MGVVVKTEARNCFNKFITAGKYQVKVDGNGEASVPSEAVPYFLLVGFKLTDANAEFESLKDQEVSREIEGLLSAAQEKANAIVELAETKASNVLKDAKVKVEEKKIDDKVDEKEAYVKELKKLNVDSIKAGLEDAGVPREKWETLNKTQLIDLAIEVAYSDTEA